MKTYFITLTPMDVFFFGGDVTFKSREKNTYFVRSEVFPQQTGILGMLRYQILAANDLLPLDTPEKKKCATEKIGGKSFCPEPSSEQLFGKIVSLSPVFLFDTATKNILFTAPMDVFIKKEIAYTIFPQKTTATYQNLQYPSPRSVYELIGNNANSKEKYTSKTTLRKGFVNHASVFQHPDSLFMEEERVGIIKKGTKQEGKEDGFYRQVFMKIKNGALSFGFYVQLEDGHNLKSGEVFLGAERSMFYLNITEYSEPNASIPDVMKIQLDTVFPAKSTSDFSKFVLISPTWVDINAIQKHLIAGIYEPVTHRFIQTSLEKTTKWSVLRKNKNADGTTLSKSDRYNMLAAGSVLFVEKQSENDLKDALERPNFRKIGYNYFHIL